MAKNHEITIKLSDEELSRVKKKAEELGMPVSTYMRFISLKARISVENQ